MLSDVYYILLVLFLLIYHCLLFLFIYQLWKISYRNKISSIAKSEFVASISHEIRTPLNAIIGMGELLEGANFTKDEKKYLNVLQQSSANLLELINNVLDMSKIEAGKIELEKIYFSPKNLIQDTVKFMTPSAQKKNLEFLCHIEEGIQPCLGDPVRIRQIIINLCTNAIKFTNKGFVKLQVNLCDKEILISKNIPYSNDKKNKIQPLLISVKDTGIGIEMKNWQNIFDSFSQENPSTTRRFGGSGLGLAITRQLIELMRGRIWVESFPNNGSIFYCLLPLEYYLEDEVKQNDCSLLLKEKENLKKLQKEVNSLRSLDLLIVEDNKDNQLVLQAYLKKTKHKISIANNGLEALEKIQKNQFDLVFMDIQMPVLDGLEATKRIRSWEKNQDKQVYTPIYALTAHAMRKEMEITNKVGCDGHMTKPISKQAILEVINQHAN